MDKRDDLIKQYKSLLTIYVFLVVSLFLICLGMGMNFQAVFNNDERMPVRTDLSYSSDRHFSYQEKEEIKYWYLTDIIRIKDSIYSLGDLIMMVGYSIGILTVILIGRFVISVYIKKQ